MSKFFRNLVFFLVIPVCFFTPTVILFLISGEMYSLPAVERLSRGDRTILFSTAYSNFHPRLQKDEVIARKPVILALGSSRVGEFRGAFFKDPRVFYNATGVVMTMSDFGTFFKTVTPYTPQILIVGMDHYFFNPEYTVKDLAHREDPFRSDPVMNHEIFLDAFFRNGGWWKVYRDYAKGKFTLASVFNSPENATVIGLRARAVGSGSINDGSDYYGEVIHSRAMQQTVLTNISNLAGEISPTNGGEYGSSISVDALNELRDFLAFCETNGIFVVGFLPPISHAVYEQLGNYPDASYESSFRRLAPILASLYEEHSFDFYDFSDITSFGSSDSEMVEAKHGSEKMYARLFIHMAEHSKHISPFVDLVSLRTNLEAASSTYVVFPPHGL